MRCPNCGRDNPEDAKFCAYCGAALTSPAVPTASEERRIVTVLFADLAGFTTLAEAMDAEDLRTIVARFYNLVSAEVTRFGGTVEKYVGDAALAIFGLPDLHEDDAERAVRAALSAQEALTRLNALLAGEGGPQLSMRIGINTGEVVADPKGGALGEFHLASDAINVAARLQQHGQAGSILIGPRTEALVRGIVDTAAVGPVALKGKSQPLEAWQVTGLRMERAVRGIPGRQAPLIGRGDEMDLLLRLYDRVAKERRSHLITVLGTPGVGKSRLQQEFVGLLRALPESPAIRKGRCMPYGDGSAFAAVGEIVRQDAHIMDGDPAGVAREKLRAGVAQVLADDAERVAASLGFLVGIVYPESAIASYDPKSAREEAFLSWRRYLTARAAAQPLLLVLEDVHWADEALLDLVDYTVARLHDAPVLLLCLARPELLERRPQWGGGGRNGATINLEPLTEAESRALIAALLDVDDLPEAVRGDIVQKAEGNPFFVEEIVRLLMEQQAIVEDAGRWRAATHIAGVPLPDTVQGVIAARLDRLPEEEKRTLQQAAVIGRIFWAGTLAALAASGGGPGDADGLRKVVDGLEDRDLIRERPTSTLAGDREYIFKHTLTREVSYASVPRAVRAPAHARVAEWIESMWAGRLDEVVDLLAYHWTAAGNATKAVEYQLRAGDRARALFSNARAVDAYGAALDLAPGVLTDGQVADVRRRRGEALERLGRYDQAEGDFTAALRTLLGTGDRRAEAQLRFEITRLDHRRRTKPFEEIIRAYEDARRIAVEAGDRLTDARCLTEIATAYWDTNNLSEAGRLGLQALEIFRGLGDHAGMAAVMNLLAMTRWMGFDLEGGLVGAEEAAAEARAAGDRGREATALSYRGMFQLYAGNLGDGAALLDEAERIASEIGDRRRLMWVHSFRTFLYLALGQYQKFLESMRAGNQIGSEIGYRNPSVDVLEALGLAMVGKDREARELIERPFQFLGEDDPDATGVYAAAALTRLMTGDREGAREALARAEAGLMQFARADWVMLGGAWMAMTWYLLGETDLAAALARRVIELVPAGWMRESTAVSQIVLARTALAEEDESTAERHLDEAERTLGGVPYLPALIELHLARHELRIAQGRHGEAADELIRAEETREQIAAQLESAALKETFHMSWTARRVQAARDAFDRLPRPTPRTA
ncbi:MAG TPA: adenylate/guanylate cyclase domain-containing protein [bacterium]